jgi:thioredoxin 1
MQHIDGDAFHTLLRNATGLVVVDFFTTWCGPCKAIAPFVDTLSSKYPAATFVKVDCDENDALCDECKVSSFPTFQLYLRGKRVAQVKGADPEALEAKVKKHYTAAAAAAAAAAGGAGTAPKATKKRAASDGGGDGDAAAAGTTATTAVNPKQKKAKPSPAAETVASETATEMAEQPDAVPAAAPKAAKPWKIKPSNNEGVLVPTPRAMKKASGVTVTDVIIGHGVEPKPGSKVMVTYEGRFPDGTVFDARLKTKQPFVFRKGEEGTRF